MLALGFLETLVIIPVRGVFVSLTILFERFKAPNLPFAKQVFREFRDARGITRKIPKHHTQQEQDVAREIAED